MSTNDKKEVYPMTTTAQKWGNSIGVRIPKRIIDKLEIETGSKMQITEDKGQIILKPVESKPTLDELLAQITPENQHEVVDWGKPEGNEIWS